MGNFDEESAATGLEENEKSLLAFVDGLRARYLDLTIENCGSGAMRSDNGTLSHFHLQSTSDFNGKHSKTVFIEKRAIGL